MAFFIGRNQELNFLQNLNPNKSHFILLTGRKAVGKTSLVKAFLKNNKGLYFCGRPTSDYRNRVAFSACLSEYTDHGQEETSVDGWEELLNIYADRSEERKILVLDNSHHLFWESKQLEKSLHRVWHKSLRKQNAVVIVVLPNASTLLHLDQKRYIFELCATSQIKLQPHSFVEMLREYPYHTYEQLVQLYTVTGGISGYWGHFTGCEKREDFLEKIRRDFLNKRGSLYNEMQQSIGEFTTFNAYYNTVLRALADGAHTLQAIAQWGGLSKKQVKKSLKGLEAIAMISKGNPLVRKKRFFLTPEPVYEIIDPIVKLWFTYIASDYQRLERCEDLYAYEHLMHTYDDYQLDTLRQIFIEIFEAASADNKIPFTIDRIELDENCRFVAIDEKEKKIFVGEVWSPRDTIQHGLKEIENYVTQLGATKRFKNHHIHYGVYSIKPYSSEILTRKKKNLVLFYQNEVYA